MSEPHRHETSTHQNIAQGGRNLAADLHDTSGHAGSLSHLGVDDFGAAQYTPFSVAPPSDLGSLAQSPSWFKPPGSCGGTTAAPATGRRLLGFEGPWLDDGVGPTSALRIDADEKSTRALKANVIPTSLSAVVNYGDSCGRTPGSLSSGAAALPAALHAAGQGQSRKMFVASGARLALSKAGKWDDTGILHVSSLGRRQLGGGSIVSTRSTGADSATSIDADFCITVTSSPPRYKLKPDNLATPYEPALSTRDSSPDCWSGLGQGETDRATMERAPATAPASEAADLGNVTATEAWQSCEAALPIASHAALGAYLPPETPNQTSAPCHQQTIQNQLAADSVSRPQQLQSASPPPPASPTAALDHAPSTEVTTPDHPPTFQGQIAMPTRVPATSRSKVTLGAQQQQPDGKRGVTAADHSLAPKSTAALPSLPSLSPFPQAVEPAQPPREPAPTNSIQVVDMQMVLGLDFALAGPASSSQRQEFVYNLSCDLANASRVRHPRALLHE